MMDEKRIMLCNRCTHWDRGCTKEDLEPCSYVPRPRERKGIIKAVAAALIIIAAFTVMAITNR